MLQASINSFFGTLWGMYDMYIGVYSTTIINTAVT